MELETSNYGYEKKEADADTIKMFVGQIPRHWNEAECQKLFEEYGPVFHLNILRDKATNASRGCCFVTYFHRKDAISAQNALHNLRVLPQMNHPVQMKPADVENRNERKLFIGMLSKSMDENDVRGLFKEFGQIEECTILRDEGRSRGCAFITYCNRACANAAIRKMNQSQTFEGCSKPIVVKFADSQKDKEGKKPASPSENNILANNTNQMTLMNQLLQNPAQTANANLVTNQLLNLHVLLQQPGIIPLLGSVISSLSASVQSSPKSSLLLPIVLIRPPNLPHLLFHLLLHLKIVLAHLLLLRKISFNNSKTSCYNNKNFGTFEADWRSPCCTPPTCHYSTTLSQAPFSNPAADLLQSLTSPLQQQQPTVPAVQSPFQGLFTGMGLPSSSNSTAKITEAGNGQFKGPEGSNLFIYHLPQDFTDNELHALFSHFGKVLSAKVFIDKQTNLSKCFGFVSYENGVSAQNAISAMNGFTIGSKRLKVQLKRGGKDKPYTRPNGHSSGSVQGQDGANNDQHVGTPP
uniref:RRM domain-containing protein n=1 Tax=Ditylenchus dipsaci TaxID=166011 RepID=A0A915E3D9_9BILA